MANYSITRTHIDDTANETVEIANIYIHFTSERQAVDFMVQVADNRLSDFRANGLDCSYTLKQADRLVAAVNVYHSEGCLSKVR